MSDFRQLSEQVWASPQVGLDDVGEAKARGIAMIVNNRPDGESGDQTAGADIERVASDLGLAYAAIPITHAGFTEAQVDQMEQALAEAPGPVLAYCRSGTRSTLLWSLVQAKQGRPLIEIVRAANAAGYDVSPIASALEMYALRAKG